MKQLSDLLAKLLPSLDTKDHSYQQVVTHLSSNSRQVSEGEVFLALKGLSGDGVNYACQAKASGAWVIGHRAGDGVDWVVPNLADQLVDVLRWFYDDPSNQLKLIGITGTNGKTSTSHYTAQLLSMLGQKVAVIGTVGNGVWGQLSESTHTTPDIVSLYRQLAEWWKQSVQIVVMEVSSHAISQGRIAGLTFEVVALTQVTRDHLDFHGSEAHYRAVKADFLCNAPARYRVLNLLDPLGADIAVHRDHIGYGRPTSAVRLYSTRPETAGIFTHIGIYKLSWEGIVPLYGRFNVENLLCAITCLEALSYSFLQYGSYILKLKAVAGRMQKVCDEPVVIVDYAHTPDALEKALQALRDHCQQGKLWVVFGAGGDRDQGKRPLMGRVAEALADYVVVTDDNPRSETPKMIADAILSGMVNTELVSYIPNRAEAICHVLHRANFNDVILIAGKGHETYQEIAGQRHPFSDVAVVQSCQQ